MLLGFVPSHSFMFDVGIPRLVVREENYGIKLKAGYAIEKTSCGSSNKLIM